MEADFSGWATKSGLKCSDGRTIMQGAFRSQDKQQVPLVWQHGHHDPENVLGHVLLEDRAEGVYAYGFLNKNGKEKAGELLEHGDITNLSIWANQLIERSSRVIHGVIREVSLVLAGANPGALIESVSIRHDDGSTDIVDDEAIIHTGEKLELRHADGDENKSENEGEEDEKTVQDVYDEMTDEQKRVVHFMVGAAVGKAGEEENTSTNDNAEHSSTNKDGNTEMTRNVFEQGTEGEASKKHVLSHDAVQSIIHDADKKTGSLKASVEDYAAEHLEHGINDIEVLFPEATALTAAPEFYGRRTEWVNGVLSGARKTPFSRIKTHWADLNFDEARAKGYIKGTMKKEEFFGTARRVTTPTTIYKKQKLDRDDIIDITDFDVVAWMKGEMRLMLDEEIARAVLIGDGRAIDDEDKIPETNIRPIATDDDMFTIRVNVNLDDADSGPQEIIDALVMARQHYRGSGQPTMYTTEDWIGRFLLLKDTLGRRLYTSLDQLATELRVSSIVPVEVMNTVPDTIAVIVNMSDYAIGADKGGQVAMFDDFDIDFNQYKYLIETRISGALTKLKSAMVVSRVAGTDELVSPTSPTFNGETGVVTIPTQTGVVYKNGVTDATLTAGAQAALADGQSLQVVAEPAAGYYFPTSENDTWTFTYHAD